MRQATRDRAPCQRDQQNNACQSKLIHDSLQSAFAALRSAHTPAIPSAFRGGSGISDGATGPRRARTPWASAPCMSSAISQGRLPDQAIADIATVGTASLWGKTLPWIEGGHRPQKANVTERCTSPPRQNFLFQGPCQVRALARTPAAFSSRALARSPESGRLPTFARLQAYAAHASGKFMATGAAKPSQRGRNELPSGNSPPCRPSSPRRLKSGLTQRKNSGRDFQRHGRVFPHGQASGFRVALLPHENLIYGRSGIPGRTFGDHSDTGRAAGCHLG